VTDGRSVDHGDDFLERAAAKTVEQKASIGAVRDRQTISIVSMYWTVTRPVVAIPTAS
jgi:hypothetical protein